MSNENIFKTKEFIKHMSELRDKELENLFIPTNKTILNDSTISDLKLKLLELGYCSPRNIILEYLHCTVFHDHGFDVYAMNPLKNKDTKINVGTPGHIDWSEHTGNYIKAFNSLRWSIPLLKKSDNLSLYIDKVC